MALGTSVEAAIEKYSAKVGLGSPAISKMELFVAYMTVTKNSISDAAGVLALAGDINYLFLLITVLTFHAHKKNLATILFTFCGGLSISYIYIFF